MVNPHRLLENETVGIAKRGYTAMNVVHYYGLSDHHKIFYKNISLKDGISGLRMFEDKEHSTIADLLERANDSLIESEVRELLDIESNKKVPDWLIELRKEHPNIVGYNEITEVNQGIGNTGLISESVIKYSTRTISDDDLEVNLLGQKYFGNIGEELVLQHYAKIIDILGNTEKTKYFIDEMKYTGKKHEKF
ncbi:hypothetical protein [Carnobacterium divergens]|uniref:Uncharacterized protein n=1 Tax=Carnobacterium divergens DSM 20623 TaxID=1449336 RepID=A0A0R2I7I9_CARDV|nr:hypothetical protein [Carnobacterium divergens]KRN57770.1 hypothetical protein IV74_GL001025 [Carnobacterium divergens DSM 20623]MDO0874398.1 hypothetical protein [Carnobacterium divergens]